MILESLVISFFYFSGQIYLSFLKEKYLKILLALPILLILWVLYYILCRAIFHEEFYTYFINNIIITVFFIGILILNILVVKKRKINFNTLNDIGFYTLVIFVVSIFISFLNLPLIITHDSIHYLNFFVDFNNLLNRGFPLYSVSIQGLSSIVNYNYVFSLHIYFLSVSYYFLVGYLLKNILDNYNIKYPNIIIVAVPLLLLSSFMGVYNFFYNSTHIIVALIYTSSIYLYCFFQKNSDIRYMYLVVFLISSTLFMRMEAIIIGYFFLLFFIFSLEINKKSFIKILSIFILFSLLWVLYLTTLYNKQSLIDVKYYYLIEFGIIFSSLLLYKVKYNNQSLFQHLDEIIMYFLVTIFIVLSITSPVHMLYNMMVTTVNKFHEQYGGWGLTWFFLIYCIIFISVYRQYWDLIYKKIFYFVVSSILSIYIISFFRVSHRLGIGDSENRMMFHFIGLILIWVVVVLLNVITKRDKC